MVLAMMRKLLPTSPQGSVAVLGLKVSEAARARARETSETS
jgi:hypothetical protein